MSGTYLTCTLMNCKSELLNAWLLMNMKKIMSPILCCGKLMTQIAMEKSFGIVHTVRAGQAGI